MSDDPIDQPWRFPLPVAFPDVAFDDIAREIERELAHRRSAYPRWVDKGNMRREEAERAIGLLEAVALDVERLRHARAPTERGEPSRNPFELERHHGYGWAERRAELLRELAMRARMYPRWTAKGNMTGAEAARRIRRLEAALAIYEGGFDWTPANGVAPAWAAPDPTPEQRASQDEWLAIMAEREARTGKAQEEMAL